jgi:peroxiredoxin
MKTVIFLFVLLLSLGAMAQEKKERPKLLSEATERLRSTGIEKNAPKAGDTFADLTVAGKKLSAWTKTAPVVLTFYRGGWCPYCVKQLKEMSAELKLFAPAQLIAVSPETEKQVMLTKKKNALNITMTSDKNNELARSLGIAFKVEDAVVERYKGYGIDLTDSQGNSDNVLPIPATFVIGRDMKVAYAFVEVDYTQRAALQDVVKAVQGLKAP